MTDRDDIGALAGEYVLGTLDAQERTAVEQQRLQDADLDRAIREWQRRLAPLDSIARPVDPSSGLFARIERRMGKSEPVSAQVIALKGRLTLWRRTAALTSAMAASLLALVLVREMTPPPKQRNLVAVLQKDAQSPAFLVSVDVDNKLMTVRPVAAQHQAGKSFELWIIHDSLGKPRSLGVVDDPSVIRPAQLAAYDKSVIESATLAISLEPEGGSPTGDPTGPVLYAGKMIEGSF